MADYEADGGPFGQGGNMGDDADHPVGVGGEPFRSDHGQTRSLRSADVAPVWLTTKRTGARSARAATWVMMPIIRSESAASRSDRITVKHVPCAVLMSRRYG